MATRKTSLEGYPPPSLSSSSFPFVSPSPFSPASFPSSRLSFPVLPTVSECLRRCFSFPTYHGKVPKMGFSSLQAGILIHVILMLPQMVAGVVSVEVNEVKVPDPGVIGHPATLECDWDTKGLAFYSIRWYKNSEQFYSFVKGNKPEKIDHELADVKVSLDYSDNRKVTISKVTAEASGEYRCEVMTDAPTFETGFLCTNFTVVKLPNQPEIHGLKERYKEGEFLNVTCMARHANPAASIQFLLNDDPVDPYSKNVKYSKEKDFGRAHHPNGTYTSGAQLSMPLAQRHSGNLDLTCIASVMNVDVKTTRNVRVEPPRSSMFNFFNTGGANTCSNTLLIGLVPSIPLIIQRLWK